MTVLDEYLVRVKRRQRTPETLQNVTTILARFEGWCLENDIVPDEISPDEMERFFDELKVTNATRKNYLTNIRAAYKYAHRRGVVTQDPTIDVYIPPTRESIPKIIPMKELKAMKERCPDSRALLHFSLLAYTGMRRAEVISLPWDQIDLKNRTINVIGKGDKRRVVPIHPTLGELLAEQKPKLREGGWLFPHSSQTRPVVPNTSDRIIRTYTNSFSHHDFRRTVATSLDANGVEEHLIQEMLGWAKRGMLARHYRLVAPERLQKAILNLYADDPL